MKKIILVLATSCLFTFSYFAHALSLDSAKAIGAVGETSSGYLASVTGSSSPEIKALIQSINTKRKIAYTKKATKAGVSADVIAKRVAQRLFQKARKGTYLRKANNKWYKK